MASVKITIRANKKLSDGTYPLVISLAYLNQPTTYIRLSGLSCKKNEWSKDLCRFKPKKSNYKLLNAELGKTEKKIDKIVEQLEASNSFTYQRFKDLYFDKRKIDTSVINAFNKKIKELFQLGKIGTGLFYQGCLNALQTFTQNKHLTFDQIDYKFLKDFEKQRRLKGNSGNTIAIYFRGLRAIHYEHCKLHDLNKPTSYIKFNVQGLTTKTRKRALTKKQLNFLINYKTLSWHEQKAVDVFLFSIWANGANLMDIAQLKKTNIVNERIEYRRAKTKGIFSVKITHEMREILNRYSNEKYLFPILKGTRSITEEVRDYNRILNKILKRIAKKTSGLPKELTIYWARHTFAQLSRESGVGIELISQAMGHAELRTTSIYLSSLSNNRLDDINNKIMEGLKNG